MSLSPTHKITSRSYTKKYQNVSSCQMPSPFHSTSGRYIASVTGRFTPLGTIEDPRGIVYVGPLSQGLL